MDMTVEAFLAEWNDGTDRLLVHTSGSTGTPKPIWVEKRKMLASARITCDFLNLKPHDTALLCMPLDYIAGKMMVVRSIERNLQLTAVKPSNHPLRVMGEGSRVKDEPFSLVAMVPSQVYCTLQVPEERQRLQAARHLIIGGGAISQELEHELQSFPNAVWSTYGMTETLSHIALRRLNGPEASQWYEPFPSVTVSLNANGCLVIDAPLVHDGILSTNDIAEIAPDGRRFRIIGRKDNVICSGGIKMQMEKIEAKLAASLPPKDDRRTFCITKRPDPKFGEVVALLTTEHRTDWQHLFDVSLSPYEHPKVIIPVDAIPLTATGKIDRRAAHQLSVNN